MFVALTGGMAAAQEAAVLPPPAVLVVQREYIKPASPVHSMRRANWGL